MFKKNIILLVITVLLFVVFTLVMLKGDILAGFFSTDAAVIQKGFDYLKGFAPETIATAVLFSMIGYFNGNQKTGLWFRDWFKPCLYVCQWRIL